MKSISLPGLAVIIIVIIAVLAVAGTISFVVASRMTTPGPSVQTANTNPVLLKKDMGEFTTDLADNTARRYVKVKVVIGYPEVKVKKFLSEKKDTSLDKELADSETEIKDVIFSVLRSKTADELKGDRVEKVKQDLVMRVNSLLHSGKIEAIYFSDIVIQ